MSGHYPDAPHKNSGDVGNEFTDFVMEALMRRGIVIQIYTSKRYQYNVGESLQGAEIKLDNRCTDTGRLSIEIAEKTARDVDSWTPSGIYRNDNTWLYIQGNYQCFWVFLKKTLINLHNDGTREECEHNGTIRKFYISLEEADLYGERFYPFGYRERAWGVYQSLAKPITTNSTASGETSAATK